MTARISQLSEVHPNAEIGDGVEIGPFCVVGPHVKLGADCRLDSHVTLTGHTTIGERNRFWPGAVIGDEPQDLGYKGSATQLEIGDDNLFREGVTIHRGADKEDGITRFGSRCFLMANSHVAHNCSIGNNVVLGNGVLLGGHVHIHDFVIIGGNTVVHQFTSMGTSAFVSGGCRVVTDLPPYMMAAGSDDPHVATVNLVGMRRRGMTEDTIRLIRQAYKRLYREHKPIAEIRALFTAELNGQLPFELANLIEFVEMTAGGKNGRGREAVRFAKKAA
jgi:UDP-N-acetylglucosamine acyltransferase